MGITIETFSDKEILLVFYILGNIYLLLVGIAATKAIIEEIKRDNKRNKHSN